MIVGVLELQGDFEKHHQILQTLGFETIAVKDRFDLKLISGLVMPGGESTTISKLIKQNRLRKSLVLFAKKYPVLGTCAGLIMLALKVSDSSVKPLGIIDVDITRNAFGRQINSSTEDIRFSVDGQNITLPTTMIRAPRIDRIGNNVEVLGSWNDHPIAIREGNHIGLNFHPELDGISYFHEIAFLQHLKHPQQKQEIQKYVA